MLLSSGEPRAESLSQQVAGIGAGMHLCQLYETAAQRMGALAAFLRAGLAQGELCLYIADDASVDNLRSLGIVSDEDLARGAFVVETARETYLREGRFNPERMIGLLAGRSAAARAAGFTGLRVAGEMSWVLGSDRGSERLIDYEARLHEFLPAAGIRALCQYDARHFPASVLRDVLRTHPLAILGEQIHDNLYFEPAALVRANADGDGQRLAWMRGQLEARLRREVALADLGELALVGASPPELTAAAARLVMAELNVEFVEIYDLSSAASALRLVASIGADEVRRIAVPPIPADSPLANGEPGAGAALIVPDWTHETRFEPGSVPRPPEVRSSAFVGANTEHGQRVLGVHSREPRIFSGNELVFLETVAIMLAHAIERRRDEEQIRTLVENAPDPIVRRNRDLRIVYVNPALERATGAPAESFIGSTGSALGIVESLVPTWELLMRRVQRTGREQTLELKASTPTGERVFDSRIVPEPGPDGAVQSLLTISRDVTELRRAEANLSAAYQQLEAQQQQMQELLSRMDQDHEQAREPSPATAQLERLTERERLILRRLAAGLSNREIGAELGLSAGTVKNYVSHLFAKLNVTDRTQAAVRALELGLVERADR